ncbi:MAG: HAD-IA family hydrolase [Candidatus Acidiferrales bacterium]|jgi:phosphoglycolate phosphatase
MSRSAGSFAQVRALVFDLDGTLIDSKLDLALAVNAALRASGRAELPHERIYGYVGQGAMRLVERAVGDGATQEEVTTAHEFFLAYYRAHMLDNTALYPGVRECLAALESHPMAVLTNKPVRFSREILEGLGIARYFLEIHGGNSFETKKPDPFGMLEILKTFGVPPNQSMVVGDSDIDVKTGRNAGAWVCGVTYGFGAETLKEFPPDILLDTLADLPAYLDGPAANAR